MHFKTRKISKKEPKPPKVPKPKKIRAYSGKHISISFSLLASIVIIVLLLVGIAKALGSIDFKVFLKVAGEELKTDAYDHTNFLILGTGNSTHEGGNLTDSIIVASLDEENKLITIISIPRDIYIKDQEIGNSRINEVYYNAKVHFGSSREGIEHMQKKVESIMGIPIHYYLKVNFDGFKELIDAIGGIDVLVESPIYDPYYPKDGTFLYETFNIEAGQHHLDGVTALKYARSRKTTSDFDRAERQQQIIYAIKERALGTEVIFSKEKIDNILSALKKNIETNITAKEILTLGGTTADYSSEQIRHRLIHDDPIQCGGFLYTPAREFYGGMFILLPAGGFEFIHRYADLNFNLPKIATENSKLHILNGTRSGGTAGEAKQILQRFCFDVVKFGNARNTELTQTTYYYQGETRPATLDFLQKLIPGLESSAVPQEYLDAGYLVTADIIIEIGSDYTESEQYIDDPFYYLPPAQ